MSDRDDDTPEGELTEGILDQLAKFERAKIAERTRLRRLRKAREGKAIAGRQADYGFHYNETRDGYVVYDPEMTTVRRIFEMFGAEGSSVYGVKAALDASNVPPPGKTLGRGVHWTRPFIRRCVFDDVYKPHTLEEVTALVSPQVAAHLDPKRLYGIWWYNRRQVQRTRVLEDNLDGERRYVTRTRYADKPPEEWIAVPVPDAGVPRKLVDRARATLKGNEKCSGGPVAGSGSSPVASSVAPSAGAHLLRRPPLRGPRIKVGGCFTVSVLCAAKSASTPAPSPSL